MATYKLSMLCAMLSICLLGCTIKQAPLDSRYWTNRKELLGAMNLSPSQCLCISDNDIVGGQEQVYKLISDCKLIETQRDECLNKQK